MYNNICFSECNIVDLFGNLTVRNVAELLKITPEQAYAEIKKLVEQRKLYKYCGGKYAKYKMN